MQTETIESLPQFLKQTETFSLIAYHTLFRGQSHRRNLLPGIARAEPTKDTTEQEQALLKTLERMGATKIQHRDFDKWDLLVLAQHFGMKTRLLDWTSNPLAALWFACFNTNDRDGYVYALEADDHLMPDASSVDPFKLSATKVVQPRLANERIVAQHGWFTVHRYSKGARGFVALENNPETRSHLSEYVIPASSKEDVVRELDRCGINQSTLFPDLEGLCRYLNWKHETNPENLPRL
ncbi:MULTISPECIES: FRG domain-containing protein [Paraburkholderia]|uniref:FRG domain-containing protein n=1 Tax=Paraburkholderia TaxID=1822464 RepID=UPI00225BEF79|nr:MULTISPECIES: FRG domain-containing protein [Paraburkholderia]MCX4170691.1 FRG domain-containing protein [Paraburkholderia madseniana]MDQ6458703.1 FRG domain-containing protein [Paraburkholderia madseniana]